MKAGGLACLSADGTPRWVKTVGEEVRHVAFGPRDTAVAAGRGETVRWAGQEATEPGPGQAQTTATASRWWTR